jgi:hypothetical protein
MENKEKQSKENVGEMHKRRETMPDGKRYIIFYTFGNAENDVELQKPVSKIKD